MVEFSFEDWLIGLSTMSLVIFGYIFSFFFLNKSRKLRIRLLTILSIAFMLATTAWLPIVIEFISVLLTENSINKIFYVYLMWIPAPIAAILIYYIASEFLAPKKKWYVFIPFLVYSGFTLLGTILNPLGIVVFIEPPQSGFIHKAGLDPAGFSSFFGLINFLFLLLFAGFGYLYKAFKSEGVIRKKFFFLSISVIFVVVFGMLDSLTSGIILVLVRIGAMSNFIFAYLGLRQEPERRKKRVKVSEEEVSFHKERNICLVCKGNVSRANYMCPKCKTLYCLNCFHALSDLENVCWVCNEAIDKNKPVTPYKEGDEPGVLKFHEKDTSK